MTVELLRETPYGVQGDVRELGKGVEDILVTQGRARYVKSGRKRAEKKSVRKASRPAKSTGSDSAGNDSASNKREGT